MAGAVVVGAGAAGLYAAGLLLEMGHPVTLVEHSPKPGQKLAITGKGRCNLTNRCDEAAFLQGIRHNPKFLYAAIHQLPPQKTIDWFEDVLHIPLKTERGRRVFPQSDSADDVVQALVARTKGARYIKAGATGLLQEGGRAAGVKLAGGEALKADAVLLACGGLSYPSTGSTGLGYEMAKQAGHSIIPPEPSLVSLVAKGDDCAKMMGLSLRNVGLTLLRGEKPVFKEQGELLFTHFGLSGPLALTASAYIDGAKKQSHTASLDLKPALDEQKLEARILRDFSEIQGRSSAHSLDKLLPAKLRPVMLARWGVGADARVNQITKAQRRQLVQLLKDFRIEILRKGDLDHAVITSGGVCVKEVDPKTMESKRLPGLYFAGEILDLDGYTGGYNLQVAWATAHAAALAIGQQSQFSADK